LIHERANFGGDGYLVDLGRRNVEHRPARAREGDVVRIGDVRHLEDEPAAVGREKDPRVILADRELGARDRLPARALGLRRSDTAADEERHGEDGAGGGG
jgi:hypothetical protein